MQFNSKVVLFGVVLVVVYEICNASYSDCGSVEGKLDSVAVSNCAANARRCNLKRNTNASMEISFTSSEASDNLKAVVYGVIMGVPVPFDLPNPDGCKDSGVACPVQSGSTYKYVTTMPISPSYPRVTVDIKWELQDSQGKNIICALIPAKIV